MLVPGLQAVMLLQALKLLYLVQNVAMFNASHPVATMQNATV
jgi:hypothetical protein